jgi:glycosyltransferase involved in cell wall biosynthesis
MADRQLTPPPLVSINIPCYHQLERARECIASLRAQTLDDLEITLLDDGASNAYRDYVGALGDGRVHYQRNPERLGAMRNMFQAICAGRGKYTIACHEDDLVGSHYLATAVSVLERDPRCGFAAGLLREFTAAPTPETLAATADPPSVVRVGSRAEFLRQLFRGIEPMFGSIVYRRAALEGIAPEHERFATLADRPYLLCILDRWTGAIVLDPLVWYRRHSDGDDRHLPMTGEHILRLLHLYRDALPEHLSPEDRALFYGYTGSWLFTLYRVMAPEARPPLRSFVFRAWRERVYDPRWSSGYGRRRLVKSIVTGEP